VSFLHAQEENKSELPKEETKKNKKDKDKNIV